VLRHFPCCITKINISSLTRARTPHCLLQTANCVLIAADANACVSHPCTNGGGVAACRDLPPPALDAAAGRTCTCNAGYSYKDDTRGCVGAHRQHSAAPEYVSIDAWIHQLLVLSQPQMSTHVSGTPAAMGLGLQSVVTCRHLPRMPLRGAPAPAAQAIFTTVTRLAARVSTCGRSTSGFCPDAMFFICCSCWLVQSMTCGPYRCECLHRKPLHQR
jgi:hypothetical protein